ncbi:hypothetical protein BSL82_18350 (plasmid) [Tardibacter chloracetimidivorans]|uniref:SnoaL-like domain-containing protein n=1 Tax=Tardibacter chloracetimidivorans TaxID=1921510 RepID=A0A1L4A0K5_9SPHN|nr:nuclear transport factor 2 family protein [Tardibacter chloracetimidivorans]API61402.1 hypothetical protein BSL82_18350 [Tardibacter chloracetimidivorans]
MSVDRLDELIAKDEIRDLLHAYCHASDRVDLELLEALFHADAELDYGVFQGGPKDFIRHCEATLPRFEGTSHTLSNITINVSGDTASSLSYITALHFNGSGDTGPFDMVGYARYVDYHQRRDGTWKIARRTVIYDWTTITDSTFKWPKSYIRNLGKRGPDDLACRIIPGAGLSRE